MGFKYLRSRALAVLDRIHTLVVRDLIVNSLASAFWVPYWLRSLVYRMVGIQTEASFIGPGCKFKSFAVRIGTKTFVNDSCAFQNLALVEIGDDCAIGPQVMFCTTSHEAGSKQRRAGRLTQRPIRIDNGCWIGARATILPGTNIAEGCVVAAGSVVVHDCEAHGLYAGVPAKRVKALSQEQS